MSDSDAQETALLIAAAYKRSSEQGAQGFLKEAGLDEDVYMDLCEALAQDSKGDDLAALIMATIQHGYNLARVIDRDREAESA